MRRRPQFDGGARPGKGLAKVVRLRERDELPKGGGGEKQADG